jgi:hypothetical protein
MTKYIFAYHGGEMPASPEEGAKIMAAWGVWMESLGDALVDGGNPAGASMTLSADGLKEGGGSNPLSGYTLIQADSMEAAIELGKSCPMLDATNGSIEIAEALNM